METIDVKGVRLRREGLAPDSLAYLEGKLHRVRRRERKRWDPFHGLLRLVLPGDYRRVPVESMVEGRILVVGCGGGVETIGLRAVGIDVDLPALRIAADLGAHAEPAHAAFLAASGGEMPFRNGAFDCLLSDNVVEHIPDPVLGRHLRDAHRVLRTGGRYVFTTPNRLFEMPAKETHVSLHSYAEWEARVREAGFREVLTPRRRSGPLGALEWKKSYEARAARDGMRLGLSNRGVRMVTIVALD